MVMICGDYNCNDDGDYCGDCDGSGDGESCCKDDDGVNDSGKETD